MKNWNLVVAISALVAIMIGCETPQEDTVGEVAGKFELLSPKQTNITFNNVIEETKDFHYFTWDHIYSGAGVAVGDINNDGLPDIFFAANKGPDALYLNEGNFKFRDITESAGVAGGEFISTGVTFADVNNDGWVDIYVCKSGYTTVPDERRNLLFINNGNLTFTEEAAARKVNDPGYSITTAFFDYDKDGDLDLYVVNQPPSTRFEKKDLTIEREHLFHSKYNASDRLYNNDGTGNFTDVSIKSGIDNFAYGLGVVTSDLNGDNWPDIYVSNDFNKSDLIYMNRQDGTFMEMSKSMIQHSAWFSMGMDINDFNNDGYPDIVTVDMPGKNHYRSKTNMGSMSPELFYKLLDYGQNEQFMFNVLQLNNGNGTFSDVGHMAGISKTDWSWSVTFGDYDNDGLKDIFVTNGIKRDVRNNDFVVEGQKLMQKVGERNVDPLELNEMAPSNPLANFMFHNKGDLKFEDLTEEWGLDLPGFSQGMAQADLDQDGDLDIIINNMNAPASLYNNMVSDNHWIRLVLDGGPQHLPVTGAKVYLYAGDELQFQEALTARGYMSCSENAVHFGLGQDTVVDRIEVLWPNNRVTSIESPVIDTIYKLSITSSIPSKISFTQGAPLFNDRTSALGISIMHQEMTVDDYSKQVLLPYKYSQLGPALATGDVDGNGLDDIFIGGSAGQPGVILLQGPDGFSPSEQPAFDATRITEDLGAEFFDIDNDGDLDLYVACGSYQFDYSAGNNMDQIFLNDGTGKMQRTAFAGISTPTKSVSAADIDNDGDIDLFVGGRVVPGRYPVGPPSYLFQNQDGFLTDISSSIVYADGQVMGMVTDSEFSDYDNDGDLDLIVVGEWTPIRIFENVNGIFTQIGDNETLNNLTGLWQSITPGDFNGDGRVDYLCGNIGLNNKFKASPEKPFKVMGNDFDQNGKFDVVLVTYYDEKEVPTRGRECSSEQLPFIAEKFPTFEEFATASIDDIFEPEMRERSLQLEAKTLESGILFNLGNGTFEFKPVPNTVQLSPVMDAIVYDFDNDGNLDIAGAGNLFMTEVETIPYDAGTGFLMKGVGNGNFEVLRGVSLGINAWFDAKSMALLKTSNDDLVLLVGNNNGPLQAFTWAGTELQ